MADSAQNKSESASPRRREDARNRGQTATSSDLVSGLVLILTLGFLTQFSPLLGGKLVELMRSVTTSIPELREWSVDRTADLGYASFAFFLDTAAMLLACAFVVGCFGNVLQVGFRLTPKSLAFNGSRFSPANGVKRILSWRGAMRTAMAIFKFVACSCAMMSVAYYRSDSITAQPTLSATVEASWYLGLYAGIVGAMTLVALGGFDFAFQRWRHEEDLKMTKQELRDETKEHEGDPQVKRRIRKLQNESANLRSLRDVPMASVVITNPTHFAVALRYDRGSKAAPVVVAKGTDLMAKRIRRVAAESGVPVIERKEVARFLYATTPVGGEIPSTIYRAVAEILAHVLNLRHRAA